MRSANQNTNSGQSLIISYLSIRKWVGVLGVTLPFICVLGTYILGNCKTILPSISQYYYSVMGNYLVGSLCGVSIFLFSYKGYDMWDRIMTNIAGICAVVTAFFPTRLATDFISCFVNTGSASNLSNTIHFVSAAIFFAALAVISIFLFTKSQGEVTPGKIKRNRIYRICGYTMLVAIALIGVFQLLPVAAFRQRFKPTLYLETIALIAFGFSWLTKGQFLLKDG